MSLTKPLIFVGNLFFFLILIIPAEHMETKLPFVLFFTTVTILRFVHFKKEIIYKPIFFLISLIIFKGVIWTVIGIINNNRGVYDVININIVWYFLFTLFILLIRNDYTFEKLLQTLIYATYFIVVFDILFILMELDFLPNIDTSFLYNPKEFNFSIYLDVGFSYLTANNINNLVFIYPLTIAFLFIKRNSNFKISKFYISILIFLEIVLFIFSGRRILFLTILLTPFYLYIFSLFLSKSNSRRINNYIKGYVLIILFILFIVINYLFISFDFSLESLNERLLSAFDSDKESIRFDQSDILFEYFMKSPIVGSGAGAEIPNFQRSTERPWSFEMSYYDDLFKTGIIGFSIFCIFIGGIFWEGIQIIKKNSDILMIGLLSGLLSTLIANASNPFLSSFDCFWTMFLPLAYINVNGLKLIKINGKY